MKKQNIIMVAGLAALLVIGTSTTIALSKNGGFNVFAQNNPGAYNNTTRPGCTAEYYISTINEIVRANPELNGTQNVRVIAKVSAAKGWYQDLNYNNKVTIKNGSVSSVLKERGWVLTMAGGTASNLGFSSKNFQEGDIVRFCGKIVFEDNLVQIMSPTFYGWNDQVDYSIIPDAVYLQ